MSHNADAYMDEARSVVLENSLIKTNDDIDSEADLFEMGVIDSFAIITLITLLEEKLNIQIGEEDLIPQNFWSIRAIAETIAKIKAT